MSSLLGKPEITGKKKALWIDNLHLPGGLDGMTITRCLPRLPLSADEARKK